MHFFFLKIIGCAGELQKIIFVNKFCFDLTMTIPDIKEKLFSQSYSLLSIC